MEVKGKKVKLSIWVRISTLLLHDRVVHPTEVLCTCRIPPDRNVSEPSRLPTIAGHRALFWVCSCHVNGAIS